MSWIALAYQASAGDLDGKLLQAFETWGSSYALEGMEKNEDIMSDDHVTIWLRSYVWTGDIGIQEFVGMTIVMVKVKY